MNEQGKQMADFWEGVAVQLGSMHRVIHGRFVNMPDGAHKAIMDGVMAAAVRAKQLRDDAIVEEWEREQRNMPVKRTPA
jgi:hypothetical protein